MGHFSDDNQKRLTGSKTDIPIYEAKMTRDSRLVVSTLAELGVFRVLNLDPSPVSHRLRLRI